MLLNIIICEDNKTLRMYYQLIIKNYIKDHPDLELKIVLSSGNPKDVELYMDSHPTDASFFLLDIEFPDSKIKGIDLATDIRKHGLNAKIVFITTHEELTTMILDRKVEPLDYIPKEIGLEAIQSKIYQDLELTVERLKVAKNSSETFSFRIGPKPYIFETNSIDYFESLENTHNIFLHSTNEITEFPSTLKDIQTRLPSFYRAHKSLLISPKNITAIDDKNKKIVFKDGSACDISRRKLVELKKYLDQK